MSGEELTVELIEHLRAALAITVRTWWSGR
jgi:hypothetical protein